MDARIALAIGSILMVSACATDGAPPPPARVAPAAPATDAFRIGDFAWSTVPGKGGIDGQLKYAPHGQPYSCASAGVLLTPDTPWVRSRMTILYNSYVAATLPAEEVRRRTPPERSQDYSVFVRRTTCDAAGHFAFSGLPDGTFYVITVARAVPVTAAPEMAIMRRVTIDGGRTQKVGL